ncbi:MAG: Ig-like domain-containing domain [Niabella sp.]
MRFKSILAILVILVGAAALVFFETGCASIVPPSGGPKDTLPPVIVNVDPPNKTLNFNTRQVNIEFDEYVELDDIYKNLIISPLPKIMPEVSRKLRNVTVKIKDTLRPNTTYVYNFARAIKDLNEGNRAKDLLYVVSTGTYFDSLELSGVVKMARTGKPDTTLTVMLYSNLDDSAVVKERPRYISRVDSTGTFFFRYLSPGTYRIYALKDEGGAYIYNGEQAFAFADSAVTLSATPPAPVRLWAYEAEKKKEESDREMPEPDKKEKRLKFQTNLEGDQQDLLQAFTMKFESPLKTFDTAKINLTVDSAFTPITGQHFSLDSTRMLMTLNMPWIADTLYNLVLEKDFASDSLDRQLLKKDTIRFKTRAKEDYGQVEITFLNLDMSVNPVLLISQGGNLKDAFPLTSNVFKLQYYLPGEYEIEILQDANKNGKWDPGNFFEHRQPEKVVQVPRKLVVKRNFAIPFEIKLLPPK